jgi:hypothetical protein
MGEGTVFWGLLEIERTPTNRQQANFLHNASVGSFIPRCQAIVLAMNVECRFVRFNLTCNCMRLLDHQLTYREPSDDGLNVNGL